MPKPENAAKVITIETASAEYPTRLQTRTDHAHDRIWGMGDVTILQRPLLGLFCSKKCTGKAILEVYDLVRGLRDAEVPVISGFHSPMEKECLDLLLRGRQPIVICPARGIERMRVPTSWREALAAERLLVVSPFAGRYRRPTSVLAEQRNRFVAAIAAEIFVAHAEPGSRSEHLCRELIEAGVRVWMLEGSPNPDLCERGATRISTEDLLSHATRTLR